MTGAAGRRLAPALLMAALLAPPALADEAEVLRPCRRADLIGFWRVVRFGFARGAEVDRADPIYQPHQRYVFNSNATMAYAASDVPPTPEQHRALLLAPAPATWALDVRGRLQRQQAGATRVETSECQVVMRELQDPRGAEPARPGDVLLTDQGADRRPIARRLLRKVEATE